MCTYCWTIETWWGWIVPEGPENLVIHLSCTRKSNVPLILPDVAALCTLSIFYLPFFLLLTPHVISFSLFHRTVQQCSSVPISWIRKTSLAALTRSWCSTEVMRTERELAVSLSLFDSQHSLIQGRVYEECACLLFLKSCKKRWRKLFGLLGMSMKIVLANNIHFNIYFYQYSNF